MMDDKKLIFVDKEVPLLVPKRILVFAPHPDDEILSTGGTILKYRSLGSDITIVIATRGSGGYKNIKDKEKIVEERMREVNHLSNQLDCKIISLKYDKLPIDRKRISKITNLIRDEKPQVILSPHFDDTHRVHRNLSLIVKESIYHAVSGEAYGGEGKIWRPFAVYFYESPSYKFQYSEQKVFTIVDIEDYWEKKKELFIEIYKSQTRVLKQILGWAEHTAKIRGYEINSNYGEAFIPDTTYCPLKLVLK